MIDGDSDSFECPYCHEEIALNGTATVKIAVRKKK